MAEFKHVLLERRDDGVATVTLNEPQVLNRINHGPGSLEDEYLTALTLADDDDAVRCIVVTGTGRAFSAGGDTQGIPADDPAAWHRFLESNVQANERIRALRTPTIGAINGLCYGAGLVMATHLDLLVAVEHARFGLIETRFGSTGAHTLPYLVGPQWAKFLAITGEIISARKAKEIGLVLEVFPPASFVDKVYDLASRVAAMPHDAVVFNRRVVNEAVSNMGWERQMRVATALNVIPNLLAGEATNAEGRNLRQVFHEEGWEAYKHARDAAFEPPWLEE
jgi:enoyl-CoA hydratase/carnithine racemase